MVFVTGCAPVPILPIIGPPTKYTGFGVGNMSRFGYNLIQRCPDRNTDCNRMLNLGNNGYQLILNRCILVQSPVRIVNGL